MKKGTVTKLERGGRKDTPPLREYKIDDLARIGGSTVRNVRAYQDRGLLPPPERRGRTGVYSETHLARLKLIGQLLSRGYTLSNIAELLEAVEKGNDLHQLLGLERAITRPWSDETPAHYSLTELLKMFNAPFSPRILSKVIELGLLEPDGLRYRAPRPKILRAGAELTKAGMPLEDMLTLVGQLRQNVERVADEMIRLVARLLDHYDGQLPPPDEIPKLANLIWQLRPLADMAIDSEVSRAMENAINKYLGERVAQVLEHMQQR